MIPAVPSSTNWTWPPISELIRWHFGLVTHVNILASLRYTSFSAGLSQYHPIHGWHMLRSLHHCLSSALWSTAFCSNVPSITPWKPFRVTVTPAILNTVLCKSGGQHSFLDYLRLYVTNRLVAVVFVLEFYF